MADVNGRYDAMIVPFSLPLLISCSLFDFKDRTNINVGPLVMKCPMVFQNNRFCK